MLSLNVRGIRSLEKRKALFIWLQKQNADIIFLQETYSTKDVENAWKCQWKGPMFFAHGSNRSCGVLVLVKDNLEFEMKSALIDDKGRFILLDARVQGNDYIMGNIYAPNKVQEQCSFFEKLQEKIDSIVALSSEGTSMFSLTQILIAPVVRQKRKNPLNFSMTCVLILT